MKLSVLHTSRGRVDAPVAALDQRISRCSGEHEIEYVFCTDEDDLVGDRMQDAMGEFWTKTGFANGSLMNVTCRKEHVGGAPESPGRCGFRFSHVAGVNRAYLASSGDILLVGDDDVEFPPQWDTLVVDALRAVVRNDFSYSSAVLGIGDPHWGGKYQGDGLLCSFILTRGYAMTQGGYILWPGYDGMMCDVDFTQKAALRGVLVDEYENITFSHNWKGNPADAQRGADWWDETHQRHMAHDCDAIGKRVYAQRLAAGFPDMVWNPAKCRWSENIWDVEAPCWRERARPPIAAMIEKYHRKACGGRFNLHAGLNLIARPATVVK